MQDREAQNEAQTRGETGSVKESINGHIGTSGGRTDEPETWRRKTEALVANLLDPPEFRFYTFKCQFYARCRRTSLRAPAFIRRGSVRPTRSRSGTNARNMISSVRAEILSRSHAE